MGNVSTNVYARFRCALLCIKKVLGIFGPLEDWFQQHEEQLEWLFGTRLPGPKMEHSQSSISRAQQSIAVVWRRNCRTKWPSSNLFVRPKSWQTVSLRSFFARSPRHITDTYKRSWHSTTQCWMLQHVSSCVLASMTVVWHNCGTVNYTGSTFQSGCSTNSQLRCIGVYRTEHQDTSSTAHSGLWCR